MIEDTELLRRFASTHAEEDFAELVRRHLNLVYSATLRQVGGNHQLAEEVTQTVFADLARRAESLSSRESLAGWLYTSAHFAAAKVVRGEQRRRLREQEAHHMQETNADSGADLQWEQLKPVIDDAMHELPETDRDAILQRYFEKKPFLQIGAKLGLTENAARMRVERALEKLRGILTSRGVASTSVALAAVLGAQAVSAAPVAFSATVVGTSIAAVLGGAATAWSIFTAAKMKVAVPVACAVAAVVALLVQNETLGQLRKENAVLLAGQREVVPLAVAAATTNADAEELERLRREHLELLRLRGEVGRLRREMAEAKSKLSTTPTNAVADNPVEDESTQQINIKAIFVAVDAEDLVKLGLSGANARTIILDPRKKAFLSEIKGSKSLKLISELQVTTLSGRQAQINAGQPLTNNLGEIHYSGPVLDVLPVARSDDGFVALKMTGSLNFSATENPQYMPDLRVRVDSEVVGVTVQNGQTVAVLRKSGDQPFVIFVTPTLIDPAGNPLHAETETAVFIEPKPVQQ